METLFSSSVDVAVVGAGVVGLASALAIQRARQDRRVMVMGEAAKADQIVTLTPTAVEFLESLGVQVRPKACAVHQMRVFSESELHFNAADSGLAALAWVIRQSELQTQLEALTGRQGISRLGKALTTLGAIPPKARKLSLKGEGFEISTSLAIAADGAQSLLRTLAGIESVHYAYPQKAVVAEIEFADAQGSDFGTNASRSRMASSLGGTGREDDCAYQWFGPHGVLALLPMKDQRYCMIWSAPDQPAHDLVSRLMVGAEQGSAGAARFLSELEAVIGANFGDPKLLSPVRSFPLSRLRPKTLMAERVALVGDAAHVVHPLAGQGLNLGLADARALAEVLRVLPPAADVGEAITLRRYARSRAEPVALMLNLTHGLQKAFEAHSDPSVLERLWRSTRELGWRGVNRLPPLKQAMIRQAS